MIARKWVGILTILVSASMARVATANDFTILVNGAGETNPAWTIPGSGEFNAIASTYGYDPVHFPWVENSVPEVSWPYFGIYAGAYDLANYLCGSFSPNDSLNLIAHSHGGNVMIVTAVFLCSRPLSHIIHLGTPVNWDIYPRGVSGYSFCQVSSFTDYVQFLGSSPERQILPFVTDEAYAAQYAALAFYYLYYFDDWDSFWYYLGLSGLYEADAAWYWLSAKVEWFGWTKWVGGDHGDLHEPGVWDAIKYECAVN